MHHNPILKKGVLFIVFSFFLFTACKKTESNPLSDDDDNGGYATDLSRIEWMSNDAISIADAAGDYYNGSYMKGTNTFGACATVSTDTLSNPHVLIVRFGNTNCQCLDGRNRRGTILISYTGDYSDSNKSHTITYQDYFVNDIQLTGNTKVIRVDTTVVGNWYYKVKVDDTMINTPNQYITWKGTLVRKWIAGYSTGDRNDNVFSISGSATLTRANGHFFACDIETPLQFALNCDYAESGVVNVAGYNGEARILNYGLGSTNAPGTCDNAAQLNIGVHVYQIGLK